MATSSRRFYRILKGSTRFQKVPPSSTKFYRVPEDSMEFQKVPPIGHRPRGSNHTRLQPLTYSCTTVLTSSSLAYNLNSHVTTPGTVNKALQDRYTQLSADADGWSAERHGNTRGSLCQQSRDKSCIIRKSQPWQGTTRSP